MNETGPPAAADPLADALLATSLFLANPTGLGGICLRGAGPARDVLVDLIQRETAGGRNIRRLPAHIDDQRLLGGVDIAASLANGTTVRETGLLGQVSGGLLLVPMAERLSDAVAGRLVQVLDAASADERFGLVLLDDGMSPEETPPSSLLDRIAFHCDISRASRLPDVAHEDLAPRQPNAVADLAGQSLQAIAATATALGIHSIRPLLFAAETARAHAAIHGRRTPDELDLQTAARLVLAPRATQLPPIEQQEDEPQPEREDNRDDSSSNDPGQGMLDDVVLEAVLAAIPPDLLSRLTDGRSKRRAQGSGGGRRRSSGLRGKPLGARSGTPRGGARLALIDTLRAAVPWQELRKRERAASPDTALILRKDDLRVRRFEERAAKVTVFCVDASGSAAAARLAEAKGAVELMLAQAYTTRSEVALVAFRGTSAEVLLPPTRSLTRARRALAELPGGGGTPLAAGLRVARELAETIEARGRTAQLVVLTDGRANIAADGTADRSQAKLDVEMQAKAVGAASIESLVVDISARTTPEAAQLAQQMQARFLALPMADAKRLHAAVTAATTNPLAA